MEEGEEYNQGDQMGRTIAIQVKDDDILDQSGSDSSEKKGIDLGYILEVRLVGLLVVWI